MKKHTKQILWGGVLFIAGGLLIPLIMWCFVFMSIFRTPLLSTFLIPASIEITIEKEGRYYLWNDYETVFEGKTYSVDKEIPQGIDIQLIGMKTSEKIAIHPDLSIYFSGFGSCQRSIGYFDITSPGTYLLEITSQTQPRIFSFGQNKFSLKLIISMFIIGGVSILVAVAGFILMLIGTVS